MTVSLSFATQFESNSGSVFFSLIEQCATDQVCGAIEFLAGHNGTAIEKVHAERNLARSTRLARKDSTVIIKNSQYLFTKMPYVRVENIRRVISPNCNYVAQTNDFGKHLYDSALALRDILSSTCNVSASDFGLTGSLAIGMASKTSDIDLVVRGLDNCHRVALAVRALCESHKLSYPSSQVSWHVRSQFSFFFEGSGNLGDRNNEDILRRSDRPIFKGVFDGHKFDIYFLDSSSKFPILKLAPKRNVIIVGTVIHDRYAILTPSLFLLDDARITHGHDRTFITSPLHVHSLINSARLVRCGDMLRIHGLLCMSDDGVLRLLLIDAAKHWLTLLGSL